MKISLLDTLNIRLFEAGSIVIGSEWQHPNVQSTFWRLYLNDRDGAGLIFAGEPYPLKGGCLYFVPSGVRFSCSNSTPLRHFYSHFDLLGIPKIAMRVLFSHPICLIDAAHSREQVALAAQAIERGDFRDLTMQCGLKALILEGLARYLDQIPAESYFELERLTIATAPIQPALEEIEREIGRPLRNPELAALCCLSTDHFTRVFRQCMNQTPALYVQERRIMRAAQRLLSSNATIDEIAVEGGFGNRYYFSRVFARHIGIGPAGYRTMSRPMIRPARTSRT